MPTIANLNPASVAELRAHVVQSGLAASTIRSPDATTVIAALAGKTDTGHTHAIANVTGLQTALDAKAGYFEPKSETGTAFDIVESSSPTAGHTYCEVTASNASPITATFVFAGMVTGRSGGIIRQGLAGVITLAGATVLYAPHLSAAQGNSPTTGSARGWIDWVFRGGSTIEIVDRSEDNLGSGGGSIVVQDLSNHTATGAAGADETLLALNVPAMTAGDLTVVSGHLSVGAETADAVHFKVVWQAEIIEFSVMGGGIRTFPFCIRVYHRSVNQKIIKPWGARENDVSAGASDTPAAIDTTGATTISFVCNRQTTNTRAAVLRAARVEIN